ncbi:MAG: TonB family protein [Muribaculaceae bacterium]|nr:TonB family protein [Muribaculaceae bacterium]
MSEKGISSRPRIVEFHATRPFVYYIVENKTGTIYFMGTYCGEEGGEKVNCSEDAEMEDSDEEQDFYFGSFIEKPVEKPKESKEEIFRSVEQMPRFPGGEAALMKYIESHLNYPPTAANISIQGKVILQFVVKKDGSIGEVKVVRSVDKDLDREAVRIIKSLPKFTPGRQNGQVVSVWYTLPVTFKLPPENNTGLNNN